MIFIKKRLYSPWIFTLMVCQPVSLVWWRTAKAGWEQFKGIIISPYELNLTMLFPENLTSNESKGSCTEFSVKQCVHFRSRYFQHIWFNSLSQPQEIKADNKEKKVAMEVNQEKHQDALRHSPKQRWVFNCYAGFSFRFSDLSCKVIEMSLEKWNSFMF